MKILLWFVPVVIILLAVYIVIEAPLEDKVYNNPISEGVEALEFQLADGSSSIRLHDADTINRLRNAYRWTNYHMYCCLESDEVYAYVYKVTNNTRNPAEPMKIYNSLGTPSFNLEFRLLLRKTCDELLGN